MDSIVRLQVSLNLLLASVIAFLEIPIPQMLPGVVFHIVKKVYRFMEYGEQERETVCEQVQSSQYGTRPVAETDERKDGDDIGGDEAESRCNGEHQPDGSKDD